MVTTRAIRLICGGWIEDAARAAYDRLPYSVSWHRQGALGPKGWKTIGVQWRTVARRRVFGRIALGVGYVRFQRKP